MAPTRITRSLRSTGPAPQIQDSSAKKPAASNGNSRKVPSHNRSRIQRHKRVPMSSRRKGVEEDAAGVSDHPAEAEEADDEPDEEEQTDVHTPPEESQKFEDSPDNSAVSKRLKKKDRSPRAGESKQNTSVETMDETQSKVNSQQTSTSSVPMTRTSSRRTDDTDGESIGSFDVDNDTAYDDDEGYDAIEKMSDVSDNSAEFEAAVEEEVMEEDALGLIDWERESIFDYDEKAENPYTDPADLHLFPPIRDEFMRDLQRQNDDAALRPENTEKFPFAEAAFMAFENWPTSESSTEPSNRSNSPSSVRDENKENFNSQASFDVDPGETTEEDEMPCKTIHSPSVALSRQQSTSVDGKAAGRLLGSNGNKKGGKRARARSGTITPVMRKVKVNPNRAIAYSEHTPYGRIVHFKLPKNGSIVVVDLGSRSTDSSGTNSPTMINLNDALVDGNRNSGAVITDAINAHLFRSYHCTRRSSDPYEVLSPSDYEGIPSGGAWRPLTRSESDDSLLKNIGDYLHEVDAHAFLDFDALESDDDSMADDDKSKGVTLEVPAAARKRRASERSITERPTVHTKKARLTHG